MLDFKKIYKIYLNNQLHQLRFNIDKTVHGSHLIKSYFTNTDETNIMLFDSSKKVVFNGDLNKLGNHKLDLIVGHKTDRLGDLIIQTSVLQTLSKYYNIFLKNKKEYIDILNQYYSKLKIKQYIGNKDSQLVLDYTTGGSHIVTNSLIHNLKNKNLLNDDEIKLIDPPLPLQIISDNKIKYDVAINKNTSSHEKNFDNLSWERLEKAFDAVGITYIYCDDPKYSLVEVCENISMSKIYLGLDTGPTHIAAAMRKTSIVLWSVPGWKYEEYGYPSVQTKFDFDRTTKQLCDDKTLYDVYCTVLQKLNIPITGGEDLKNKKEFEIYDCFMFFNEVEILEIRLDEMYDIVENFIIVEANKTHTGIPRESLFLKNKHLFEKYLNKIVYRFIDLPEIDDAVKHAYKNEAYQRNYIGTVLKELNVNKSSIIIVSDCDEIPSKDAILNNLNVFKSGKLVGLSQPMYYYKLNLLTEESYRAFIYAITYYNFDNSIHEVRWKEKDIKIACGWHFSWIGDRQNLLHKLKSYSHANEFNTKNIQDNIEKFLMFKTKPVDIDNTFPKIILNNLEKYKNFIYYKEKIDQPTIVAGKPILKSKFGIKVLYLHHNTSNVTLNNFNSFINHKNNVVTLHDEDCSGIPGSWIVPQNTKIPRGNNRTSDSDTPYLYYILENDKNISATHYLLCEWDCYTETNLETLLYEYKDNDVTVPAKIIYENDKNWGHFTPIDKTLPIMGIVPSTFLLFKKEALYKVAEMVRDNWEKLKVTNSECRLGTACNMCNLNVKTFNEEISSQITWFNRNFTIPNVIYHPVKEIFHKNNFIEPILTNKNANIIELKKQNQRIFNSGVIKFKDRYLLAYRQTDDKINLAWLDNEFNYIKDIKINLDVSDPKIIKIKNKYILTYSYAGLGFEKEYMEIMEIKIDDAYNISPLYDTKVRFFDILDYPGYIKKREKSWSPFEYNGELYYVYKKNPHQIVKYDEDKKCIKYLPECNFNLDVLNIFGNEIRGNGNTCRLNSDYYFTTFHIRESDHYKIGYYIFEAVYPFRPIAYCKNLLIDSREYVKLNKKGGYFNGTCIFPGSTIEYDEKTILISYGINDWQNHLIKYDKSWILDNCIWLNSNIENAMTWTKLLSFEITDKCNLTREHSKCPINDKTRYLNSSSNVPLTDDDIINFSIACYAKYNFNGYITFWGYNEPLLEIEREIKIINKIKSKISLAKFGMVTNGLLLKEKIEDNMFLSLFDKIIIDNYHSGDNERNKLYKNLKNHYKNIIITEVDQLDDRMKNYTQIINNVDMKNCFKPDYEMIVDYYGNLRLCCNDYKNSIKISNIKIFNSYDDILNNWLKSKNIPNNMGNLKTNKNYNICQSCIQNTKNAIISKSQFNSNWHF